jgi:uncharacterized surface protein with fasciclin (FAS1) repeats
MTAKTKTLTKTLIALSAFAFVGAASAADMISDIGSRDILSVAKQKSQFNTFTKVIEAAGLTETLSAQGPVTIFAPTDEAFAKLPPAELEALLRPENREKLVKILSYHVVPGKALEQEDMKRRRDADTAAGQPVDFELVRGRLRVEDARITGDYTASNGVIHGIDKVLIPNSSDLI